MAAGVEPAGVVAGIGAGVHAEAAPVAAGQLDGGERGAATPVVDRSAVRVEVLGEVADRGQDIGILRGEVGEHDAAVSPPPGQFRGGDDVANGVAGNQQRVGQVGGVLVGMPAWSRPQPDDPVRP
jgi:hypothetical protein